MLGSVHHRPTPLAFSKQFLRDCLKSPQARASRLAMRRIASIYERFPARTRSLVIFAHPPLLVDPGHRPLHHPPAREHLEAFLGISFCQSTSTPSLAHSAAHLINTSSGAGFFGRSRSSTPQPRVFSTQSAPLFSPR